MYLVQSLLAFTALIRFKNYWDPMLLWAVICAAIVAATVMANRFMEKRWPQVNEFPAWAQGWPLVARIPWLKLTHAFATISIGVVVVHLGAMFALWALNPDHLSRGVVRTLDVLLTAATGAAEGCFIIAMWKLPTSRPRNPQAESLPIGGVTPQISTGN